MPTLFLSRVNDGPAIPTFVQKGIADQMPGVVGEVPVYTTGNLSLLSPIVFQFHVMAMGSNKNVDSSVSGTTVNVFKGIRQLARNFDLPVGSFKFDKLTPTDVADLKGMGLQQDLGTPNLFIGTPAVDNLARLNQLTPLEDRIRPGHINFNAYFAWIYLMKGVQIFTTVRKNPLSNINTLFLADDMIAPNGGLGDIKTVDGGAQEYENKNTKAVITTFRSHIVVGCPTEDMSKFEGSYIDADSGVQISDAIFLPYFTGMLVADKFTAFENFTLLFHRTTAGNLDACNRIVGRIRSGVRQLAFSRSGIVLSHIYRCFGIAMTLNTAEVSVVLKGNSYAGTVIRQKKFELTMYSKTVACGDIAEDLKAINRMEYDAEKVCGLLNAVETADGKTIYSFKKEEFMKSRSAVEAFLTVDKTLFHSTDTYDQVIEILEKMEYGDTFPVPAATNIAVCMEYIRNGDRSKLSSYPAYITPGLLNSGSRTFEALSMYGPKAPSCNTGDKKALQFSIPGEGKSDPNLVKSDEGNRLLRYFPFWSVPIGQAVSHWDRVFSTGAMFFPRPRSGKKEFVDLHRVLFSVSTDATFLPLYENVKGIVNDRRAAEKSGKGLKRKKGDDGSETTSASKRAKALRLDDAEL